MEAGNIFVLLCYFVALCFTQQLTLQFGYIYFEALSDAQFFTYLILSSALLKNENGRNIERRVWMYNRNQQ